MWKYQERYLFWSIHHWVAEYVEVDQFEAIPTIFFGRLAMGRIRSANISAKGSTAFTASIKKILLICDISIFCRELRANAHERTLTL